MAAALPGAAARPRAAPSPWSSSTPCSCGPASRPTPPWGSSPWHRARDSARHLSGGERQRLALARAWAVRPRLLLLDEPTAALDPTATEAVESIVREIRTDGAKVLMTTHNLGQAMRLADDIVFIEAGRVREHSPSARFFSRPLSQEARLFIRGELPWRIAFPE